MHPFHFCGPQLNNAAAKKIHSVSGHVMICYQGVAADVFTLLYPQRTLNK